jgi:hypothetical protein
MSVLIKGMEMPTEGTVIAVYKIDGNLYATRGLSGRLCPLVPVPEHGAMMDRDEFFAACPELVDGYKQIADGLVVIETEEG